MNTQYIQAYATSIIGIINNYVVPVLMAIAFLVFLYGVAKAYIFSEGSEDKVKDGHQVALWGVIGFVIMISVWGLVNIVKDTLIISTVKTDTPTPPTFKISP